MVDGTGITQSREIGDKIQLKPLKYVLIYEDDSVIGTPNSNLGLIHYWIEKKTNGKIINILKIQDPSGSRTDLYYKIKIHRKIFNFRTKSGKTNECWCREINLE